MKRIILHFIAAFLFLDVSFIARSAYGNNDTKVEHIGSCQGGADAIARNDKIDRQIGEVNKQIENAQAFKASYQAQIEEISAQIEEISAQINQEQGDMENNVARLSAVIDMFRSGEGTTALREEEASLKRTIQAFIQEITNLNVTKLRLESRLSAINANIAHMDEEIKSLNNQIAFLNSQKCQCTKL